MGAFYNSICLPGEHQVAVRSALDQWLGTRGFVRSDRPPLFDLDAGFERSAFIVRLARWTVVLFSNEGEEHRLIRALATVDPALMYLWVYDSTEWGFDLFESGDFAGSFSSDPAERMSFGDQPAGSESRPWADASALSATIGHPVDTHSLRTILNQRPVFKESVAREFCALIGAEGALASYDELEASAFGAENGQSGPKVEQLLYERADRSRGRRAVALHDQRVTTRHPTVGDLETGTIEIPAALLREIDRGRKRMRRQRVWLRPLSFAARAWRGLLERSSHGGGPSRAAAEPGVYQIDDGTLFNPRHGCRIDLAKGVSPATTARKPSAVFSFRAGDVVVTANARRLDTLREVLRRPDRSEVVLDEPYFVGKHQARWLRFRLPPGFQAGTQGASILSLHVVETGQALYTFLYRVAHPGSPEEETAIRRTVESFRLR